MTVKLLAVALLLAGAAAQAGEYKLDPTHSFVVAEVDHFGTSTIRVRFGPLDGDAEFDKEARRGRVGLRIAVGALSSGVPALDARLRERDLLAADEHPEAFFVAERFEFDAAGKPVEVRGEFTLRGASRPLTLRMLRFNCYQHPLLRRQVCGGDFDAEFKRTDYGISYGLPFVGERVRLLVTVEAVAR